MPSTPKHCSRSARPTRGLLSAMFLLGTAFALPAQAQITPSSQTAAGSNRPLQLAADSPFRDPDIIYLEADELINDEQAQTLTAIGEVEGRYQDRTLRANRVDYNLATGQVFAVGDVVLIDATGDIQYADKLELSDELQAGSAANFTARLSTGATTAARFVSRSENGEVELYNATYTACEICRDSEGNAEAPTWRLRARRVRQDADSRTIRYRDAVIELFGLPVFYTPYLAHPDPSQDRASGLLVPTVETSGARGFTAIVPYYWAIDDYTEATITPHVFSKVNPLLELEGRRRFHTGEINLTTSITRATLFDRNGDPLDDPSLFLNPNDAEQGAEVSSHFFMDGYFRPSGTWSYGYTVMLQSDDNYLQRYGLNSRFDTNGLVPNEIRRNTTQAFLAGQGDNFRLSAIAVGFQDVRTRFLEDTRTGLIRVSRDDNAVLPIIAPKIQGEYYIQDPILDGRLQLFGDATYLTRETGTDYGRLTGGADYSKTWIAPGGIEIKPFAWGRIDNYDIESEAGTDLSFTRGIGQAGVDMRYPFIRRGDSVDLIVEPRVQLTQSVGDAKLDEFFDPATGAFVFEDGQSPELDRELLFEANKADGFDFFQEGRRADIGARVAAQFDMAGEDSEVALFVGRSYSDGVQQDFAPESGLSQSNSDYVAELDIDLGGFLTSNTWVRYDEDRDVFSRIESSVTARTEFVDLTARYYSLDAGVAPIVNLTTVPQEEISGTIRVRPFGGWSAAYTAIRDLDRDVTRTQRATIGYRDDCTLFEVFFEKRDFDNDVIQNEETIGIRLTLQTLGSLGGR